MNNYFASVRRMFARLLIATAALLITLPAAADNSLANPGFVVDLTGWTHGYLGGREVPSSDDSYNSPSSGSAELAFITPTSAFLTGIADLYQVVSVTAGTTYEWSSDVRNLGAAPNNYAMRVWWCSDPQCTRTLQINNLGALVAESGDLRPWRTYSGRITAPEGARGAAIHLRMENGGVARFDNISFGTPSCLTCSATVPAQGFVGQAITMTADVQSSCPITGFTGRWDFGDSTAAATTVSARHTYGAPGTYRWTWTATNGSTSCVTTGTITLVRPLRIASFVGLPPQIAAGEAATLSWIVEGATSVLIDNGVGVQPAAGAVTVKPNVTTTYTLTAMQGSATATANVTVQITTAPVVTVTALPRPMVQPVDTSGGTTSYSLLNAGGAPASVSVSQTGSFFFTPGPLPPNLPNVGFFIAPGEVQTGTFIGKPVAAGAYHGAFSLSGDGVPAGLQVPIDLLSAAPSPNATMDPAVARIDVMGTGGSVDVANRGTGTLTAIAWSDVPWLIAQRDPVVIAPGATAGVSFTIDRTKRTDAVSAAGALWLFTSSAQVQIANVYDTLQTTVTPAGLPALQPGEVELLAPGVGHIGSSQTDLSLFNPQGSRAVEGARLYFARTAEDARTTSLPNSAPNAPVNVADPVKNIFGTTEQLGTVHIRAKDATQLVATATMMETDPTRGVHGSHVPVFRSDRGAAQGESIVLSGLTTGDVFVQETVGYVATGSVDFYAAAGSRIAGTLLQSVSPFGLAEVPIPAGAASAVITNTSGFPARLVAYARLIDTFSNDTWTSVDWSRYFTYAPSEPVVIPVAGRLQGTNSTFFLTDIAITNRGSATAAGTFHYVTRTGQVSDHQISLGANQTQMVIDVIEKWFNNLDASVGFLMFTPVNGSFAITSRVYTANPSVPIGINTGVQSAGVPVVAASSALTVGMSRIIAPLQDADRRSITTNRAGTFRTNLGLEETAGRRVTVRVTLRFTSPFGVRDSRSRDFALDPNQFMLLNSIADQILGPVRLNFGDLRDLEADFQVISGEGAAIVFTSSIDNVSNDSIVRVQ